MYRRTVIMPGFNFMGGVAIISLSLVITTALASEEDSSLHPQLYYLRQSWPPRDLQTSASFPIGYGLGGVGFLPKGGFLGVGGLGGYGGYGDGGFIGGYGGGPYGGYGGFGGLQKSLAGSGYSKGQSGVGAQNQAAAYQAGGGHKGQIGVQNSQGYSGAEDAQKQNQQSSGYYGDEGGQKKKYEKGGSYEDASNYGQAGKNIVSEMSAYDPICAVFVLTWEAVVAQFVEALLYKPAGRGFDSRWCQ
jgi:hypothetical protein